MASMANQAILLLTIIYSAYFDIYLNPHQMPWSLYLSGPNTYYLSYLSLTQSGLVSYSK